MSKNVVRGEQKSVNYPKKVCIEKDAMKSMRWSKVLALFQAQIVVIENLRWINKLCDQRFLRNDVLQMCIFFVYVTNITNKIIFQGRTCFMFIKTVPVPRFRWCMCSTRDKINHSKSHTIGRSDRNSHIWVL